MVRIGLMASRNFIVDRRAVLGGLSAVSLVGWPPAATAGERVQLVAKPIKSALRPDLPNSMIPVLVGPSPILRFKQGTTLDVALQNDLAQPTAINWHGLDAAPSTEPLIGQASVAAGAGRGLSVPLRHAGTLFADIGLLADGAAKSLPLVVEEGAAPTADRDEVLLIEDFRVRPDGSLVAPGSTSDGAQPVYTVNGLGLPEIATRSNQRLRLRFINACQRHVVAVKIEGLDVRVMAFDSRPAEPFFARNGAMVLAPGGRADAFVDVTLPPGASSQILLHDGKEARPIARLTTSDEPPVRPAPLPLAAALDATGMPVQLDLRNALRQDIALSGAEWVPPAKFAMTAKPAFRAKQGRIVALALTNRAEVATVFHLHGHHFRLLDRLDDGWKPYWLDTLAVEPGQTQRIAFAAETAGHWLLESTAADWSAPKLLRWYAVE